MVGRLRKVLAPHADTVIFSVLIASACAMFGSVAMPANAQTTVNAAGGNEAYLLWLWVSILIIAPAVGAVCAGIAFAFGKRAI